MAKHTGMFAIAAGALILNLGLNLNTPFSRMPSSLPSSLRSSVSDDTLLYQQLSEINVPKSGPISFDRDIQKLAAIAPRYRENLPAADLRLSAPMKRVAVQKYTASSKTVVR